ncbi:hypothetical protein F2Q70_00043575 [Brassica cretica]|uniref:Uncharacterized protein n=1 Tax=Brassica cretica TaxID=69181 RepID=A0A8S9KBE5_BRACR|nr:hypothetical protein F2Q70_00043575 [Brassica cretica]KAF2606405.1 hypothetical protein F2Q68_00044575 [Brassica cretica]
MSNGGLFVQDACESSHQLWMFDNLFRFVLNNHQRDRVIKAFMIQRGDNSANDESIYGWDKRELS